MASIALDAGHDSYNFANVSPDKTYYEYEFAWDMCLKIEDHLKRCGVTVYNTRKSSNDTTDLSGRVTLANNKKVDLFVSIHSNAAGNSGWYNAKGLSAHIYPGSSSGNNVAQTILSYIFPLMNTKYKLVNRGIISQDLYVTRVTNMTAVLFESGFHTDKDDIKLLTSQMYRRDLATCISKGICKYLNVSWKEPSSTEDAYKYNYTGICNSNNTIIRENPNTSSKQLNIIQNLTEVNIVKRVNDFYMLVYGAQYGYVESSKITANVPIDQPVEEVVKKSISVSELKKLGYTSITLD